MPLRKRYVDKNKYGSRKIIGENGQIFDSEKEQKRFNDLCLLQRAGEIRGLQTQVKFVLIPAQREADTVGPRGGIKKGRVLEQECSYYADFVYFTKNGEMVVEDTKSVATKTKDYIIKRKLMLYVHGIKIQEIL